MKNFQQLPLKSCLTPWRKICFAGMQDFYCTHKFVSTHLHWFKHQAKMRWSNWCTLHNSLEDLIVALTSIDLSRISEQNMEDTYFKNRRCNERTTKPVVRFAITSAGQKHHGSRFYFKWEVHFLPRENSCSPGQVWKECEQSKKE